MVTERLRCDWATQAWNGRGERRWVAPKQWSGAEWTFARGVARDLVVGAEAHRQLHDIWNFVRSIDEVAHGWLRTEVNGVDKEWTADLPRRYVARVIGDMRQQGIAEGGAIWIAGERAALRAAARVKDRVRIYSWSRGYRPGDVVATIRLPFGAQRGRALRDAGDGYRFGDDDLLGWFEVRDVPEWANDKERVRVRPEDCAYAECALLSAGWAVRFISAKSRVDRLAVQDQKRPGRLSNLG